MPLFSCRIPMFVLSSHAFSSLLLAYSFRFVSVYINDLLWKEAILGARMSAKEPHYIPLMALSQAEMPLRSLLSRHAKGAMGSPKRVFLKSPLSDHRSMTATCFALLVLVLLINVILIVVLFAKLAETEGIGHLYRIISTNNCKAMERQISFFHLGINILSTLVLQPVTILPSFSLPQ